MPKNYNELIDAVNKITKLEKEELAACGCKVCKWVLAILGI